MRFEFLHPRNQPCTGDAFVQCRQHGPLCPGKFSEATVGSLPALFHPSRQTLCAVIIGREPEKPSCTPPATGPTGRAHHRCSRDVALPGPRPSQSQVVSSSTSPNRPPERAGRHLAFAGKFSLHSKSLRQEHRKLTNGVLHMTRPNARPSSTSNPNTLLRPGHLRADFGQEKDSASSQVSRPEAGVTAPGT